MTMTVSELAKQLKIKDEHILPIIQQLGFTDIKTLDDPIDNEIMASLVAQIEKFTDVVRTTESQPAPTALTLQELAVNINVELEQLTVQAQKFGLNITDPKQQLTEEQRAVLFNNLTAIENALKPPVAAGAPVESQPVIQPSSVAAKPAVGINNKNVSWGVLDILQSPYFILGIFIASVLITVPVYVSYKMHPPKAQVVVVNQDPKDKEKTDMQLVWKLSEDGFYNKAYELAGYFKATYPQSEYKEEIYFKSGHILFNWKRYPESLQYQSAIKELKEAIRLFPKSSHTADAWIMIADSYYRLHIYQQAVAYYRLIIRKFPYHQQIDRIQFSLAESLYDAHKYQASAGEYLKLISKYGQSQYRPAAYLKIAHCFKSMGKLDDALNAYNKFIKEAAGAAGKDQAFLAMGTIYYGRKQYEAAINAYRGMIGNYPYDTNNARALFLIADAYLAQNNFTQAIKSLQEVIYNYPGSEQVKDAKFKIADAYYQSGDFNQAVIAYQKALQEYPSSKLVRETILRIGSSYMKMRDYTKAIESLNQFILDYHHAADIDKVQMMLAQAYYAKGMYAASAQVFEQLAKKYPHSRFLERAFYMRADAYYRAAMFDKARAAYIQVLTTYPKMNNQDFLYFRLGECSWKIGSYDEALDFLKESMDRKLFSEYRYKARLLMAKVYQAKNQPEKAIEQLEKIVNNDFLYGKDIYYQANNQLSEIYLKKQYYQNAILLSDEVIQSGVGNKFFLDALRMKSAAYMQLKQPRSAATVFRSALGLIEEQQQYAVQDKELLRSLKASVHIGLADILFEAKDNLGALINYSKASKLLRRGSEEAWAIYQIANVYTVLGNPKQAQPFYKKLKNHYPDSFWAGQISWNAKIMGWQQTVLPKVQR